MVSQDDTRFGAGTENSGKTAVDSGNRYIEQLEGVGQTPPSDLSPSERAELTILQTEFSEQEKQELAEIRKNLRGALRKLLDQSFYLRDYSHRVEVNRNIQGYVLRPIPPAEYRAVISQILDSGERVIEIIERKGIYWPIDELSKKYSFVTELNPEQITELALHSPEDQEFKEPLKIMLSSHMTIHSYPQLGVDVLEDSLDRLSEIKTKLDRIVFRRYGTLEETPKIEFGNKRSGLNFTSYDIRLGSQQELKPDGGALDDSIQEETQNLGKYKNGGRDEEVYSRNRKREYQDRDNDQEKSRNFIEGIDKSTIYGVTMVGGGFLAVSHDCNHPNFLSLITGINSIASGIPILVSSQQ